MGRKQDGRGGVEGTGRGGQGPQERTGQRGEVMRRTRREDPGRRSGEGRETERAVPGRPPAPVPPPHCRVPPLLLSCRLGAARVRGSQRATGCPGCLRKDQGPALPARPAGHPRSQGHWTMDLTQGHMAWGRPTEVLGWPEALDGETQEGPLPQSPCLSGALVPLGGVGRWWARSLEGALVESPEARGGLAPDQVSPGAGTGSGRGSGWGEKGCSTLFRAQ